MIKAALYVPVVLSLVVLGAHFMRYGDTLFVAGALLLIVLLFVRQPWVARLMQVVLVLGALEWVGPRDELMKAARTIAESIASKSPKAMRLAKECMNGIELLDIKTSYRFEQGFTLELYTSPDSQEARDAFVEKRNASFDSKS